VAVAPALRVVSVTKAYGATVAVREASLALEAGKLHAIVGENGAGKSTLSSIAAGLVAPDAGHVEVLGEKLSPHTAREAIARGVGMVQQHFRLIDALTVLDNAMLGVEPTKSFGRVDVGAAKAKLAKVQAEIGSHLAPGALVGSLGVGDRQRLEIARVLFRDAKVLLLDEPTAVLSPQEAAALYATLRRLASSGRAIAVVTHKIDEVLDYADAVTVMRRGRVVSTRPVDRVAGSAEGGTAQSAMRDRDAQRKQLLHDAFHDSEDVGLVVARGADDSEKMLLEIEGLKSESNKLRGVRLHVRAREIVGMAGVEGNGQKELVDVLAGLTHASGGTVRVRAPIEVVHDDRHKRGLVLDATVADNAVLGEHARFSRFYGLDVAALRREASRRVQDGGVAPPEIDLPVAALSGGNQQKLVMARALARDAIHRKRAADPRWSIVEAAAGETRRVLVLAQPTRGVDIAAARQIHLKIVAAAEQGAGVLVVSADLDELRALCHRIVVIARGRIVGDARRDAEGRWDDAASNERLGARMIEAGEA
jgi:simple sugar transport system ATP-binding protein